MENEIIKKEYALNWKRILISPFRKWAVLIVGLVVGALIGVFGGMIFLGTSYQAEATYMVTFKTTSSSLNDIYSQWNLASKMLYNCQEISKQNKYLDMVAKKYNETVTGGEKEQITKEMLAKCVSISRSASGGTLLMITVKTGKEEMSTKIIEAVNATYKDYIESLFPQDSAGNSMIELQLVNTPEAVYVAKLPKKVLAILGGFAGAVLCYVVLCFVELGDSKITSATDIVNRYNAPILGSVYSFEVGNTIEGGYNYEYKAE